MRRESTSEALEVESEVQGPAWIQLVFSFACGLDFAVLQFSYFFLMEAYLSSQYLSYFVTLFFWLCGFLAGLRTAGDRWFSRLLILGVLAYYAAWSLTRWIPFHPLLYPSAALCSILSGLLPGYFFPFMARRFAAVRSLLFHENNGFILGILVSLRALIHCGSWFLAYAPLLGAAIVLAIRAAAVLGGSDRSLVPVTVDVGRSAADGLGEEKPGQP